MIKTRFAPSPTGILHLGNARTALFNYLYARKNQNQNKDAEFILRIEDTDDKRSEDKFIDAIVWYLIWLGIEIDTKKIIKQSERGEIYQNYLKRLINLGCAYPCFCSKQRLDELKSEQIKQKKAPTYDGKCRNLNQDQVENYFDLGLKPAYRFKIKQKNIVLNDLRHGKKQNLQNFGDFVIQKPNGQFIFLLTNLIDDIEQKITHTIRGEDHLTNSVLQTAISESLDVKAPIYLHLSLITNQEGKPLSKRDKVFSLEDLRQKSYHPLAIINYLARLSTALNKQNVLSMDEIAASFEIESLAKSASKFDITQLNFWQKKVVTSLNDTQLRKWLEENNQTINQRLTAEMLKIIQENLLFADDFVNLASIFINNGLGLLEKSSISQEIIQTIEQTPLEFFVIIKEALLASWQYENLLEELIARTQLTSRALFIPLRFAISGQIHGPKIQDLYRTIENELMLKRLNDCIEFKNNH